MKRMILSLVAAIVAATATYAQSTLVATLTHGETIKMYTGSNALFNAHNAAVSGDIINLSGGTFNATTITKGITIRGTGIDEPHPTVLSSSNFWINIPEDDPNPFSMEGVRYYNIGNYSDGVVLYNAKNPTFIKCQINKFSSSSSSNFENATFINCKIDQITGVSSCSANFINCFIRSGEVGFKSSFVNCILRSSSYSYGKAQFINCIIEGTTTINSSNKGFNCVQVASSEKNIFTSTGTFVDCSTTTYSTLFKDYTGTYSDDQTFELTDEAKTTFLGADGTQVGLYGGMLPYNSTPSYPRITKFDVAKKATADGKLSVDIEVSAAQ